MKLYWLLIVVLIETLGHQHKILAKDSDGYLQQQTFMSLKEAEKRWGKKPFDLKAFKTGDAHERAKMAVSLIQSRHFIGKTPKEVKSELGTFSGHFWNDFIPTYLIEEGWRQGRDTWQLVFLLDENGRIGDVRIHKNCC